MGNSRLGTFFFVIVLVVLVFLLFQVLGGDWRFWLQWSKGTPGGSPLDAITNGLSSVTQGLTHVFSRFGH